MYQTYIFWAKHRRQSDRNLRLHKQTISETSGQIDAADYNCPSPIKRRTSRFKAGTWVCEGRKRRISRTPRQKPPPLHSPISTNILTSLPLPLEFSAAKGCIDVGSTKLWQRFALRRRFVSIVASKFERFVVGTKKCAVEPHGIWYEPNIDENKTNWNSVHTRKHLNSFRCI